MLARARRVMVVMPEHALRVMAGWGRCAPTSPRGHEAATLPAMGAPVDSTQTDINPGQLAEWMSADPDLQVIDVRDPYEGEAGYIEGSRHIPLVELSARAAEIERGRAVVFYCRVG